MKTKQPRPKLNRQILDEAAAWFVDFRVGDVDSAAREGFDRWLRQSPEHIRAYMEIARTYVDLPTLTPRGIDVQELIAHARSEGNVLPFNGSTRSQQPVSPAQSNHPLSAERNDAPDPRAPGIRGPRIRALGIAASMALLCAASLLLFFALNRHSTYTTQIGERRSITLADGSTIDLNARSEVRIRFSKTERDVELIDGQALFEVAKDSSRPFVVRSGETRVRAVGTQFDVYRKQNGTTVTVIEGRVAVLTPLNSKAGPGSDGGSAPVLDAGAAANPPAAGLGRTQFHPSNGIKESGTIFVSAGEQLTVTDHVTPVPARTDVAAAIGWVQHRLVFDASRLSDVVDDFNRYNARQIVIDDRALDDFHVSGVYSSTDPASLLRFLRSQSGIDVVETDQEVRISRQ